MQILTANQALTALRALRCSYRPDTSVVDGAWLATCPNCRTPAALVITETRPREVDDEHPPVRVGCRARCCEPRELADLLLIEPDLLALRHERDHWRLRATWAIASWRRHIGLTTPFVAPTEVTLQAPAELARRAA